MLPDRGMGTGVESIPSKNRKHGHFIIYLPWVLCLSVCDCVCVTIAERSAILLVLVIKLTKETRRRAWRGRDRDGEIGKGQIREGGYEWTFHC